MNAKASSALLPTQSVVVGSTTGNDCSAAIPGDMNSVLANLSDADDDGGRDCRACRVCGQLSHGYHFGILACRACAAFFRRTVVEKKTYRCRHSGQCQIRKEMRNMCRSCRFDLCIELGMNKDDVQMYRDPIGKRSASKIESSVEENGKADVSLAADAESDTNYGSPRLSSSVVEQHVDGGGIGISSTGAASLSSVTVSSSPSSSTRLLHVALPQPIRPLQQQPSGDKQHQLFPAEAAGGTLETPTIALLPCAIPSGADPSSVLQRLVDGYRNFQSSQKSLYTVMYPDNIFAAETYRMVKHAEYVKMERGCISLQFSMLVDCFQPFDSLNQQLKVAALRVFSNRFTHLDQCFRTATIFPANDDPRFVLHYGQYMNVEKLDEFFTDIDSNEEELHKSCKKTFQRCRDVVNKMHDMAVRDVEVAALAAIILWNELAYMNVEGTDRVRSAIFAELHSNMILTYGIANTGIRLGSLMDLIHDMNVIEKEIRESVIIGNFFNPNFAEVWDDV
uniref:Nuclear receptor domain-containing protein n=1 Tax=Globodera pallida TaxID=36090 RepID=A0A183BQE3_GLOPA